MMILLDAFNTLLLRLVYADSASSFMLKRVRSGAVDDEDSCRKYLCGGDEKAQQTEVNIAAV